MMRLSLVCTFGLFLLRWQVEQFWSIYSHLKRPTELPSSINFHLFREGITPMWEDAQVNNKHTHQAAASHAFLLDLPRCSTISRRISPFGSAVSDGTSVRPLWTPLAR